MIIHFILLPMTNPELRNAWEFVNNTDISIFLTGKAGTGKTTFLKTLKDRCTKRKIVVAPTGVAAINAGGVTIHSFFQLPLSPFVPSMKTEQRFAFSKEKRNILKTLDLLIIDEISMVRCDLLDAIDDVLRRYREHDKPFGGVQLLMIGDLQQLTPVVTPEDEKILSTYYQTPYFFGSKALQSINYVTIELTHVYRQQDERFINILNHVRNGKPTDEDLSVLNSRVNPSFTPQESEGYIRLTTHNRIADEVNDHQLQQLNTPIFYYKAETKGEFPEYIYPTSPMLQLRVGAQVMFIKNDNSSDHLYYNGKIGHITYLDKDKIEVLCPDDEEAISVEKAQWDNVKYTLNEQSKAIEPEVQGSFFQYPLRLAWAITIHKSQGLTFEHAIIDAQLSFASGQVYVALSRCKTLEGMVLSSPLERRNIITDSRVDEYIAHQHERAQESIRQLPVLKQEYERHQLIDLFTFQQCVNAKQHLYRVLAEDFPKYPKIISLHHIAIQDAEKNILIIAEKWTGKIRQMPYDMLRNKDFLDRVGRSCSYFLEQLDHVFASPLDFTKGVASQNKQNVKRLEAAFSDARQTYLAKRYLLKDIETNGFTVDAYIKYKQEAILDAVEGNARKRKKEKRERPNPTSLVTLTLFRQGKSIEEIAKERELAPSTIFSHLASFVASGAVDPRRLLSKEKHDLIFKVIAEVGADKGKGIIKEHCPDKITYNDITVALGEWKKKDSSNPPQNAGRS